MFLFVFVISTVFLHMLKLKVLPSERQIKRMKYINYKARINMYVFTVCNYLWTINPSLKIVFTFLLDSLLNLLRKLFSKMKINILKGEKYLFLKKKMKNCIINVLSIKELNKQY